jgi:hypothetical protein
MSHGLVEMSSILWVEYIEIIKIISMGRNYMESLMYWEN